MPRLLCADHEDVVRAINEANWDTKEGRPASSLFKGENISLSRLECLDLISIIDIFLKEMTKCPLVCVGKINVGGLRQIGQEHGVNLTVEQDPNDGNPAHAEIPQNITKRSLALQIAKTLEIHSIKQDAESLPVSTHDYQSPPPSPV